MSCIRYSKFNITIQFIRNAAIPAFKCSTLRGGLGDVLLAEHCIAGGNCRNCSFRESCVVPGIYYHPLKIVPPSVNDGGSLGYTFECLDRRTYVNAGDQLEFSLLLYGDVIVYFSVILDALYRLGMAGIGQRKQGKFQIVQIYTQDRSLIFGNGTVNPRAVTVQDLMQDADRMRNKCGIQEAADSYDVRIRFLTPWTQKWRNDFLENFQMEAFLTSVHRRVYLLHCMEGIDFPEILDMDLSDVSLDTLEIHRADESRYSNTHESKIRLHGIEGEFVLHHVPGKLLSYIFAGAIAHIGKNTSIGFGQYEVIAVTESRI